MTESTNAKLSAPAQPGFLYLRTGPTIVLLLVMVVMFGLNLIPTTLDYFQELYPGAGVKPVVREFGFPMRAVSIASTEKASPTFDPFGGNRRPTKIDIEYTRPGPRLKWEASTNALTFEDGSTTYIATNALLIDMIAIVVVLVLAFAVCKFWTNRRRGSPAAA